MKKFNIAYYVVTGLLSFMLLYSAIGMYLLQTEMVQGFFVSLGFPAFIVVPLAILKIAGVVVLLTRFNHTLKEWAYAGFFFNFTLAAAAHINVADGEAAGAFMALILLISSYLLDKKSSATKLA